MEALRASLLIFAGEYRRARQAVQDPGAVLLMLRHRQDEGKVSRTARDGSHDESVWGLALQLHCEPPHPKPSTSQLLRRHRGCGLQIALRPGEGLTSHPAEDRPCQQLRRRHRCKQPLSASALSESFRCMACWVRQLATAAVLACGMQPANMEPWGMLRRTR